MLYTIPLTTNINKTTYFATRELAEASAIDNVVDIIYTGGYYTVGDNGNTDYTRAPDGTLPGSFQSLDGAWWTPKNIVEATFEYFGAKGDGVTDDTLAIQKAFDWMLENNGTIYGNRGRFIYDGPAYVFPNLANVRLRTDSKQCEISLETNDYWFKNSGTFTNLAVIGFLIDKGKGACIEEITTEAVQTNREIFNNRLTNFTECGFGTKSNNNPYWKIRDNYFRALSSAPNSRCITLPGLSDACEITGNDFAGATYQLVMGAPSGSNATVSDNNWIAQLGDLVRVADIWVRPNTVSSVNSGEGLQIVKNRFGNENMPNNLIRLYVANSNGTNPITDTSDENDPTGFFVGGTIRDNRIYGQGTPTRGFVYSCINNISIDYQPNLVSGARHPDVFEFKAGVNPVDTPTGTGSRVMADYNLNLNSALKPSRPFNRVGFSLIFDEQSVYPGFPGTVQLYNNSSSGYFLLGSSMGKNFSVTAGTNNPVPDIYGNTTNTFGEITLGGATAYAFKQILTPTIGRTGFIEVDVRKSGAQACEYIRVVLLRGLAFQGQPIVRFIKLEDYVQTVSIPFVIPDSSLPSEWYVLFYADGYVNGITDRFVLGNWRVYHAASPTPREIEGIDYFNANFNYNVGLTKQNIVCNNVAPITCTIVNTNAVVGSNFYVVNVGSSTVNVGGIVTLTANQNARLVFNGTIWVAF